MCSSRQIYIVSVRPSLSTREYKHPRVIIQSSSRPLYLALVKISEVITGGHQRALPNVWETGEKHGNLLQLPFPNERKGAPLSWAEGKFSHPMSHWLWVRLTQRSQTMERNCAGPQWTRGHLCPYCSLMRLPRRPGHQWKNQNPRLSLIPRCACHVIPTLGYCTTRRPLNSWAYLPQFVLGNNFLLRQDTPCRRSKRLTILKYIPTTLKFFITSTHFHF